jgi:hypothetical protein
LSSSGLFDSIARIMWLKKSFGVVLFILFVQVVSIGLGSPAFGSDKWYVALRGGVSSPDKFIDFFKLSAHYEAENIAVLDVGMRFAQWKEIASFYVEGQFGQHWGVQSYQEVNIALTGRVHIFPATLPVPLSLAAGSGLSYTSTIPIIETDIIRYKNYGARKTSRLLHYLMVEAAFGVIRKPKIETFVRIHHRSGIFGLLCHDYGAGSNFLTGGIRYYF